MSEDELRYQKFSENWDKNDPKHAVLRRIGIGEKVLDVGCAYGSFGKALITKGCKVDGIEFYEPALIEARKHLGHVYEIDLNRPENLIQIDGQYDVITFMDVLEHCVDPQSVLEILRKNLVEGGRVYVSVPNIANFVERARILMGKFDYQEYGVLDRTHLKFYTKKTSQTLVANVYKNSEIIAVTPRIPQVAKICDRLPTLLAMQFVLEGSDR